MAPRTCGLGWCLDLLIQRGTTRLSLLHQAKLVAVMAQHRFVNIAPLLTDDLELRANKLPDVHQI